MEFGSRAEPLRRRAAAARKVSAELWRKGHRLLLGHLKPRLRCPANPSHTISCSVHNLRMTHSFRCAVCRNVSRYKDRFNGR